MHLYFISTVFCDILSTDNLACKQTTIFKVYCMTSERQEARALWPAIQHDPWKVYICHLYVEAYLGTNHLHGQQPNGTTSYQTNLPGSFPGFLRGTNGTFNAKANGAPKINPLASNPTVKGKTSHRTRLIGYKRRLMPKCYTKESSYLLRRQFAEIYNVQPKCRCSTGMPWDPVRWL